MARARKPKPRPSSPRARRRLGFARDDALEAAIIDDPLDPAARMVYGDWLEAAGDPRGEWFALSAAVEADPRNVRLRSLAVDFLGAHGKLLHGAGTSLLPCGWIGWRGGFIDEIRAQPYYRQRSALQAVTALLEHPSSRFVRHVALGELGELRAMLRALVEIAPPLLETLVVVDREFGFGFPPYPDGGMLARLPTLRRLGLAGMTLEAPVPGLEEVTCWLSDESAMRWILGGGCPNATELVMHCERVAAPVSRVAAIAAALPKLRRLRLLELADADVVVAELRGVARGLELLDVSYSSLTDVGAGVLADWPGLQAIALHTAIGDAAIARLALASRTTDMRYIVFDDKAGSWLHHRLATEGRDALRAMPGIGKTLFDVGTRHSEARRLAEAMPLLDASLTFPARDREAWGWGNAAIAHERAKQLDDAELIAREGLLRTPNEPNLYAIVIGALRRSGRCAEALALVPRALASLECNPGLGAQDGGPKACLDDCLLVLQQAGRHAEVLRVAKRNHDLLGPRIHACLAMSHVARGDVEAARAAFKLSVRSAGAIHEHARAVLALAAKRPRPAAALAALARVKAADYPEWHFIARDPLLARLADVPAFQALVATPPG